MSEKNEYPSKLPSEKATWPDYGADKPWSNDTESEQKNDQADSKSTDTVRESQLKTKSEK